MAMAAPLSSIISLLALLLACSSTTALAKHDFDFFVLRLMWPGAYCAQNKAGCCMPTSGPPAADFFVSGLLPYSKATGKPVTGCTSFPFDINELSAINGDLNQYWSNIRCPSSNGDSLWKSAWNNNGQCSTMTQAEYFDKALELRREVDVLSILNDNDVRPSKESAKTAASQITLYNLTTITSALRERLGATPIIECNKTPENIFQIYQIHVCVDKDAETIIECPIKNEFHCSPFVMFYPFDISDLQSNYSFLRMTAAAA